MYRSESERWDALWIARLGTRRGDDYSPWPRAINVTTRLKHFGRDNEAFVNTVDSVYNTLCEVAHPNIGSQEVSRLSRFPPDLKEF